MGDVGPPLSARGASRGSTPDRSLPESMHVPSLSRLYASPTVTKLPNGLPAQSSTELPATIVFRSTSVTAPLASMPGPFPATVAFDKVTVPPFTVIPPPPLPLTVLFRIVAF